MLEVGILVEAFKSVYDVFNTHSSSKKAFGSRLWNLDTVMRIFSYCIRQGLKIQAVTLHISHLICYKASFFNLKKSQHRLKKSNLPIVKWNNRDFIFRWAIDLTCIVLKRKISFRTNAIGWNQIGLKGLNLFVWQEKSILSWLGSLFNTESTSFETQ